MIMHVLANRQAAGWGSWLKIVETIPQFMAENELPTLVYPPIWEPSFIKLLHAVDGVFDRSVPDTSKGALYWGDLAKIERVWFQDRIVNGTKENFEGVLIPAHRRVANMNGLNFFD